MKSILLVCPPRLKQLSLATVISAIPQATVIAKATNAESVLLLISEHNPDVLLIDASSLENGVSQLLSDSKRLYPDIIRVVLTNTQQQKQRFLEADADLVVNHDNLVQDLTRILDSKSTLNL